MLLVFITAELANLAVQNCAYLSNMAVNANYRRRGYGNILLDAADDVARIAGEKQIYLHLRYAAGSFPFQQLQTAAASCTCIVDRHDQDMFNKLQFLGFCLLMACCIM